MNKRRIKNECDNHNRALSAVRHRGFFSVERFLNFSAGNLLINGGSVQDRIFVIKKEIVRTKSTSREPVIVFSNNSFLQDGLIELVNIGDIGRLFVCSQDYKFYDFFRNMQPNLISDYFSMLAQEKGYRDTSELHDYIGAFLNTLKSQADINLSSIKAFLQNSDADIANAARSNGNDADCEIILASGRGGVNFRRLVSMVGNAFETLTVDNCSTGFNINSITDKNCVLYINTNTCGYEFLGLYFLQELKQCIGKSFTLVFDDCLLLNNNELMSFLNVLKQRGNVKVLLSTENIMSLPSEKKLSDFSGEIVFLNGTAPAHDIQAVLSDMGEYSHFEVTSSSGTPPKLFFSFLRTENRGITPYSRAKVLLEEEYGNAAVLRGHRGAEILVVKKLVF
ncbi:MAG: hypothetical protein J1E81_02430 [Eubacterium sp.]|nr:hypothetical protein [Eubacterium sp.]